MPHTRQTVVASFCVFLQIALPLAPGQLDARADKKSPQNQLKPRTLPGGIVVSKQTTAIAGPFTDDGYLDYTAALDAHHARGVTAENNAAVPFWRAVGPEPVRLRLNDDERFAEYFRRLDILPPPPDGDYFVELSLATDREIAALRQATHRPWSQDEFPQIAQWLADNAKPLAGFVEASRRTRFYSPILHAKPIELDGGRLVDVGLLGASNPGVRTTKSAIQALLARAMLHLNAGQHDRCADDLIAAYRLARLFGECPLQYDRQAALAFESHVQMAERSFLAHANLSAPGLTRWQARLSELPPRANFIETYDVADRYRFLDAIQRIPRQGKDMVDLINNLTRIDPLPSPFPVRYVALGNDPWTWRLIVTYTNWNHVMRHANERADRIVEILQLPDQDERWRRLQKFDHDEARLRMLVFEREGLQPAMQLERWLLLSKLTGAGQPAWSAFQSLPLGQFLRPVITRHTSLVCRTLYRVSAPAARERHLKAQDLLTELTLALLAHRSELGAYPESLEQLTPKYLAELPIDPLNGERFHYRRSDNEFLLYSLGPNGKKNTGTPNANDDDDIITVLPVTAD